MKVPRDGHFFNGFRLAAEWSRMQHVSLWALNSYVERKGGGAVSYNMLHSHEIIFYVLDFGSRSDH